MGHLSPKMSDGGHCLLAYIHTTNTTNNYEPNNYEKLFCAGTRGFGTEGTAKPT